MATTTNFGWETPDDTDLVKDGALAMRTLGNAIDTSLVDLKGGTTGQVLSKASNTDLDFSWIAVDPLTILDAKGDLISATAADTPARLAVGTNGQLLSANSSTSTGLEWIAAPTAGANWSLLNSGGTALTAANVITVTGISGKDKIMVLVENASSSSAATANISLQFNTDTGSNYYRYGSQIYAYATYDSALVSRLSGSSTSIALGALSNGATSQLSGYCLITGCNSSGVKVFNSAGAGNKGDGTEEQVSYTLGGYYNSASTISSVTVRTTNTFDNGTVYIYTSA